MKALVIVANGLHLGYLGCYGNDWIRTPTLDQLASEAVVFDQHYADRPDAAGACLAWRTGRFSFPLPEGEIVPSEKAPDLFSLLREHGVTTSAVLDASRPGPSGLLGPWDQLRRVPSDSREGTPLEQALASVQETLEQLDRERSLAALGQFGHPAAPVGSAGGIPGAVFPAG